MNKKKFKKTLSILYVEDELTIREELSEFLEIFCDTLYVAANGQEGLKLFKKHHPKIVVTDIKMPKMDGIELSKEIFKDNPDIHIIFTTAFTDMNYLQKAIEIHADGYIVKPIDLNILENMLQKIIKIDSLQQELELKTQYELKKKSELETIFATTLDGIAILDLSAKFAYANSAFERMLGYSLSVLKKINAYDIIQKEKQKEFELVLNKVLTNKFVENFQIKCITKEDKTIILDLSLALMPDKNKILIAVKDVTKEIFAQRKIREYVEIIDENIITSSTDLDGVITYASEAFCKISGYTKDELIGKKHNIVRNPDVSNELYHELWHTISQDKVWKGELKNRAKNKIDYWVFVKIYPTFDENGNKIGYTSIRHDITNLKKIKELSIIDGLTKAYNRHHFNEIIEKFIKSAQRNDELIAFAIFDIDYFKQYNDTYGHQKGDHALQLVVKSMQEKLQRADDYLFRLGGEEFGVLFKPDSLENSVSFVKSLIKNIESLQIEHKKNTISPYVTISAGLICKKATLITNHEFMYKNVDDLLYKAKKQGRNQVISNQREGYNEQS